MPFIQLHFLLLMTTVVTIQMTAPKDSTTLVETNIAILLSVDFCVVFDVDVSFPLKKKKVTSVSIVIVFLDIEVNVH